MRLYGSLKELVSAVFRKDTYEITLRPNQSTTYTAARDIQLPAKNGDAVLVSSGDIVNADIAAGAAVAYSKLALSNSIVNADVAASAAVAYSKLALSNSIVNADIAAAAAIVDTKLATIATAGKVSNSATTATNANTASAIVARDASGNFSAGTVTATSFSGPLTGNVTGNVSGSAATFTGSLAGDVSGTQAATSVDKIKGKTVSGTAPTDAQQLIYNNSTSQWVPASISGDITMTNAGVTSIGVTKVTNAMLAGSIDLTTKVTGSLPIANGGTGQATQQAALTALAGTQASGQYLRSNGTNTLLSTIQAADVPTLNQNTTGTAANVTGTVAIGNGGTGQTTKTPAFDALSPTTTKGDLVVNNGTNNVRFAVSGVNGQVLSADSTAATGLAWASSLTNPMTTLNDIIVGGTSGTPTRLPTVLLGDVSAEAASATVTLTIATPCVVTLSTHGLVTGDKVYFTTTGALPTGLSANTTYFVIRVDANTFNVATSLANAVSNTKINTSGTQSGVHTLFYKGLVVNPETRRGVYSGSTIASGYVGQQVEGTISSPATAANGAWVNIGSVALTPGVWLIYGSTSFYLNGTIAGPSYCQLLIGSTSASSTGTLSVSWFGSPTVGSNYSGTTVTGYLNVSSSVTYYLNLSTQYTSASGGGGVTSPRFFAVRIA